MNFLPNPVAINIPLPFPVFGQTSLPIYWYGIMIVLGAVAGAFLASYEAKRRGMDPDHVWNGLLFALVFGVIGARLYHVLSDVAQGDPLGYFSHDFLTNLVSALNPRVGGLGIYGAVVGGIFGLWIYTRYAKLRFWQWVDVAIPGLTLGQAIGRWGNFFNQELYGWPTTMPWGIPIDAAHRLRNVADPTKDFTDLTKYPVATTRFHPTFLYESLAMLAVTILLVYISRRYADKLKEGDMLLLYGMAYPLVRFFTEMERPDAWLISGVPAAQIVAVASFVVCAVWFAYRHTGPATAARPATGSAARSRARRRQSAIRDTARPSTVTSTPPAEKPAEEPKS